MDFEHPRAPDERKWLLPGHGQGILLGKTECCHFSIPQEKPSEKQMEAKTAEERWRKDGGEKDDSGKNDGGKMAEKRQRKLQRRITWQRYGQAF
ncbi:MAG: hypothetical protein Q4F29_09630 [Lachnospiraceae bacterium]|nr:hypothetical protein [Lachnospiraceae bacterium]